MSQGDSPSRAQRAARLGRNLLREAVDIVREALSDHESARLPPLWLRDVGPSDFEATGQEFLRHFIELGQLRPNESVLEIGCGPGRMALPLTGYLDRDARYVGVDVVAPAIRWCRRNLSRRHPNFRFLHADVQNARYNPSGCLRASQHRLPFGDASFDFVFLTSVFTHMRPDEIQHYVAEVARVLRPSGRVLCTFFLLNPTQQALADEGRNQIDFRWDHGTFRARDQAVPEAAVALSEDLVRAMLATAGLAVSEPVRYGAWSGRADGLSLQDIVVARPSGEGSARREAASAASVAVVIPNHNGEAWLTGCLEGLARQELGDFEVVLVDNGSTDGSVELVRKLRPDARLVLLGENRGFAAAVNLGIAATKAEYVALLNTDTIARPSWLSALVRALRDAPAEVAAAAPRMLRLDEPATVDDAGDALYWTGAAEKVGHGQPASEYSRRREIFSPSAGASLYRRSFLEDMGGFDERFFAYLEDVDLGLRGRLCGYRFIFEPAAEILHKGHGSGVVGGSYVQLVTRNRLLLFAKNVPWSLLLKRFGPLLRGQIYLFLAYRRPLRSLAGYASFARLVPHVLRERRRMRQRLRLEQEEIDRMLAPLPGDSLLRAPLVRRLGRWIG